MTLSRMGIQLTRLATVLLTFAIIDNPASLFAQGVDPELGKDWSYMLGRYIIPGLIFLGGVAVIVIWLLLASRRQRRGTPEGRHGNPGRNSK